MTEPWLLPLTSSKASTTPTLLPGSSSPGTVAWGSAHSPPHHHTRSRTANRAGPGGTTAQKRSPAAPNAAPATRKQLQQHQVLPLPHESGRGLTASKSNAHRHFPDSETACQTKAAPALAGASDASLAKIRLINGTCFHRKQQKWLQYYNRRI